MNTFINRILKATGKYTIVDFAFLKTALLALGILLGTYFTEFFSGYTSLLWIIYIISFFWIMYRTFFKHTN